MITADQLVAHLVGDYIIQSDWMAQQKTNANIPAAVHAATYTIPFLWLNPSLETILVIILTHYLIDRYRLARYVCWVKNFLQPRYSCKVEGTDENGNYVASYMVENWLPWKDCNKTGYPNTSPPWLSVWLLIIADNTLHILINGLAFKLQDKIYWPMLLSLIAILPYAALRYKQMQTELKILGL